jgi:F-type H+-transporting ATPase subunit b
MKALAMMAESSAGGTVEEIARTFGVNWPHLVAQMISFSIVCALLYWLAYRPVLRMLDERRQQIAQGLANTEKTNATLASIEAQRQEVMAAAHAEATRVIEAARDVARRVRERETQRALATAEQIVTQASAAAAREHARMMTELRRDVGRLVVKTAAAVTGKVLSSNDQRRLAEETARQLA